MFPWRPIKIRSRALAFLTLIPAALFARGSGERSVARPSPVQSAWETWWRGGHATGTWFGVRDSWERHGLFLDVEWRGNALWNVAGGLAQRFGYDEEWNFRGLLDVAQWTGWETLEGLTIYGDARYRDGDGVNRWLGTGDRGQFGASNFQSGRFWRFRNAFVTYTTPKLFGVKEFLTLSGGWQNPTGIFLNQPLNRFFLNTTLTTNRGIRANDFGWGGSFASWGGYARIKPRDWLYVQSGLYLAVPDAGTTSNHGLYFAGARPPNANGVYWLSEIGVTPEMGAAALPGHYAVGFLYWGVENTSFFGTPQDQRVLLYWQADQMLFREPFSSVRRRGNGQAMTEDDPKVPLPSSEAPSGTQGLYAFSLINFAPSFNNPEPFYFHAGLVYRGLLPTRDADQCGVAFAFGRYSAAQRSANERIGEPARTFEGVMECSYRVQVTEWAYVQPDAQYILRPGGADLAPNAMVFGLRFGVSF